MLNIKDITERNHAEPAEVADIRRNIIESFGNLEFQEGPHKYYLHNPDGSVKEMYSVSSICHRYEPYTDWDDVTEKYALKHGMSVDQVSRMWKENNITATSNGSLSHAFAEAYMYFFMGMPDKMPYVIKKMQYEDGYLIPYGNKQKAIAKYYEDLFYVDNFYPVMPEAQIYIDSVKNPYGIKVDIAGTFDALFAYKSTDGKIKLSIRDWKTNKTLNNEHNRSKSITLNKPFDTLEFINEPLSLYTLQLSLYQLGIQQLGYEISDRTIIWVTDDASYSKIQVKDVTESIITDLGR